MTCPPFCDGCGGNLGHPANADWLCRKCKAKLEAEALIEVRRDTDPKTGNRRIAA